ncbi:MAG: VWA domain-containing protein [Spirochaetales bacterium]|nr:VWA domain-containing protein [Spirochaetales bacterium]
MKNRFFTIILLSLIPFALNAENIAITGIDSTGILRDQRVDLYITQTDDLGTPIENSDDLTVYESPDGDKWFPVESELTVDSEANRRDGIGFLMLMDNSGSMYDDLNGKATDVYTNQRMTHAKSAMQTFIGSIEDSRDRVGLVMFNTDYRILSESTKNRSALLEQLEYIKKPEAEKAYTELYASLDRSSQFFEDQGEKGRKIIIVLSDGENYSFYKNKGELHPEYGDRLFTPEEAAENLNKEGITLYAIHFGLNHDPYLGEIARETGGRVFDARNGEQLALVYNNIRRAVMDEYRVSYKAGVYHSPKVFVKIGSSSIESEARYYYNSALFGESGNLPLLVLLLFLIIAVALWLVLTKIRLERVNSAPHIELLGPGGLRNKVQELSDGKTIIGTSENHDMTIMGHGAPSEKESATIIYDEKKQAFTLVAGEGEATMVNNKQVSEKELQAGDVIKVGDNLIIFDDEGTQVR